MKVPHDISINKANYLKIELETIDITRWIYSKGGCPKIALTLFAISLASASVLK